MFRSAPPQPPGATSNKGRGMNERGRPAASRSALGLLDDETSTASAVREMFAAVAPRYDFFYHFLSFGLDFALRGGAAKTLRDVLGKAGSRGAGLCGGTSVLMLA